MKSKSVEYEKNRKNEILDACQKIYLNKGFHDITIKDISLETSISRPSIYNYYQTKEEIFLGILIREYELWYQELNQITEKNTELTKDELAEQIAKSLKKRNVLLKVTAMNLYEIEQNSRYELLLQFKKTFILACNSFCRMIQKFTGYSSERVEAIHYAFFPFMYGIYPYVSPTEKQLKAMKEAKITYHKTTIEKITKSFLNQILK